ncbi:hypothetical protein HZB08_03290, partial [Candidatus Saganbacteria bacterium]|nr:hypothetical protein [Candidatus Saganbacteria bacterium]
MLYTAVNCSGPVAVRYPRGSGSGADLSEKPEVLEMGRGEVVYKSSRFTGSRIIISNTESGQVPSSKSQVRNPKSEQCIIAVGSMVYPAVEAAKLLEKEGVVSTVINARFVKPLDRALIVNGAKEAERVVTVEEGVL